MQHRWRPVYTGQLEKVHQELGIGCQGDAAEAYLSECDGRERSGQEDGDTHDVYMCVRVKVFADATCWSDLERSEI